MIDTILGEQAQLQQLQEELIEEPSKTSKELQDAPELCAGYGPWRRKEEILPLLTKEDSDNGGSMGPQNLDLKPLPVELNYAFLEKRDQCHCNLFSIECLSGKQPSCHPQEVQTGHWMEISHLKGISPLVCTHHIYMEEEAKPVRQP